jgi:hypothetical protein
MPDAAISVQLCAQPPARAHRLTQARSVKNVAIHRDDMVADAPVKRLRLCITSRCAQSGEQGQQVFIAVTVLTASPAFQATIGPSFVSNFERLFFDWTPP